MGWRKPNFVMLAAAMVEIAVRNDRPAEVEAKWATAAGRAW